MNKQYSRKFQKFCKNFGFKIIKIKKKYGVLDQEPPKTIVSQIKEPVSLFMSLVLSIGLTIFSITFTSYLAFIKLIAIFVILYKLAY